MMKDWTKTTVDMLTDELWGEKIERPLLKRVLAFLVDSIVLTPFLTLIPFVFIGHYEIILAIDFPITVLYFTILNSRHFSGQTIGKRIFKLQVVDQQGSLISLWKSLVRSLPISLLINFVTIHIVVYLSGTPLYEITETILVFTVVGLFYFPIIKLNRQSIHDLIAGTQVISNGTNVTTARNLDSRVLLGYFGLTFCLLAYMFKAIGYF